MGYLGILSRITHVRDSVSQANSFVARKG